MNTLTFIHSEKLKGGVLEAFSTKALGLGGAGRWSELCEGSSRGDVGPVGCGACAQEGPRAAPPSLQTTPTFLPP